jgi:hypothetical protein
MKKIGSITVVWNGEDFIGPHMDMLSVLDKNVVVLGRKPWANYQAEYGLSATPDRTRDILLEKYPNVVIVDDNVGEFKAELYNQALSHLKDCDIVFKLDVDQFFTKQDFKRLLDFIQGNSYDCYRLNYEKCSTAYSVIGRFDTGIKNEKEHEVIAFNPDKELIGLTDYRAQNPYEIEWDDFSAHHFRGWKPNVTNSPQDAILQCPQEIKQNIENWRKIYE